MTTKQQTLHDILVACAGALYSSGEGTSSYVLSDGVRLPCPCPAYCVSYKNLPDDQDWQRCSSCSTTRDKSLNALGQHGEWCDNCQGRSWVPNPDPYAYRRAIRTAARVGHFSVVSDAGWHGDLVIVQMGLYRAVLTSDKGFHDQEAEARALKLMLEQIPNVELGE